MAQTNWQTARRRDRDVVEAFASTVAATQSNAAKLHIRIAEQHHHPIDVSFAARDTRPELVQLLALNTSVAHEFVLTIDQHVRLVVRRPRDKAADNVELHYDQAIETTRLLNLLATTRAALPEILRLDALEEVVGSELADFYRAREATVASLEATNQKLIEDTVTFRRDVDAKAAAAETQRKQELEQARAALAAEFEAKQKELEARAIELEAYKKTLDDRQSKHARRALRETLQNVLTDRGKQFSLTKDTTGKRTVVHVLFGSLIAVSLGYLVATLVDVWGEPYDALIAARVVLGVAGTAAAFVLYIRWSDQWFREHANEEFRLKRMSLDVDRASWIVETALEWQQENQQPIPSQLLEQLTRDLFTYEGSRVAIRHPIEELGAAVLSNATSLKLNLPGVGEATLGRRGAREVAQALNENRQP